MFVQMLFEQFVDEVIVIDDASTDNTAVVAKDNGAKVISHKRNKGYIEAIKSGFKEASGDIVITFDADGEFLAVVEFRQCEGGR